MQVVTRYAPTISGELHIGGLYNALLNYLYAKKHGGLFKLRLDGMDLNPPHDVWQQNIPRDLELFGLHPDETLKCSDRIEMYKEVARELSNHPRSYYCDCTVQDLLKRARDGSVFYHLYRPEKYPPYCQVCKIQVFGIDSELDLAAGKVVKASHSSREYPVTILTDRLTPGHWWEPVDVGFQGHPIEPSIVIDLGSEQTIRAVQITWKDRPVLRYEVSLDNVVVARMTKEDRWFVDVKPGQPFMPLQHDLCHFAARKARYVGVKFQEFARPVDKPYFYDYHCRTLGKRLDLNHRDTVLRLTADSSCSKYDTAYWYSRMPNLVLTSIVDDRDLKVTHCIRGVDIEPWLALEGQVALALNAPERQQLIHGLVIDGAGYKYSKWIGSTPVRSYITGKVTPEKILSYIAQKAKIIKGKEVLSLDELIQQFSGDVPPATFVIEEDKMLEELSS